MHRDRWHSRAPKGRQICHSRAVCDWTIRPAKIAVIKASNKIAAAAIRPQKAMWVGALLLGAAGALGGGLNYLVQVQAAKSLPLADYGILNVWIADTTVLLSLGVLCQMWANYVPLGRKSLVRSSWALLLGAVVAAVALSTWPNLRALAPWAWTLTMLPVAVICGWLIGQLQLRLEFFAIGLAGLCGSAVRLAVTMMVAGSGQMLPVFYLAFALSGLVSAIVLACFGIWTRVLAPTAATARDQMGAKIACAFVLTVAGALLPQVDVICLRMFQSADVIGDYSRVSLVAKGIWFSGQIVLQVTLPLRIRAQSAQSDAADERTGRYVLIAEVMMLVFGVAGAVASAWLGPMLTRVVLGYDLSPYRLWFTLTGLISVTVFVLLRRIQQHCARLDWRKGGVELGGVAAMIGLSAVVRISSVQTYLAFALAYYLGLVVCGQLLWRRHRRSDSPDRFWRRDL